MNEEQIMDEIKKFSDMLEKAGYPHFIAIETKGGITGGAWGRTKASSVMIAIGDAAFALMENHGGYRQ